MRPIDADNLMDFYLMRPTEEFLYERQYTAEDVALKIENTPTIDTVKHGHWENVSFGRENEKLGRYWECSVCNCLAPRSDRWMRQETVRNMFPYCFRCGTKMDEEVSE